MELSPKQKRNVISADLDKYTQIQNESYNDFSAQRQNYIDLNYSLALAYDHDKQKAEQYIQNAESTIKQIKKQDERATYERDEDSNKTIMIPHKDDQEIMGKFQTENRELHRKLEEELQKMNNEARLYEEIKAKKDKGIDGLTPLYVGLQEGLVGARLKHGELAGSPIDADRFRKSYPNATKTLEEKVEKWAEKENNKDKGMQR